MRSREDPTANIAAHGSEFNSAFACLARMHQEMLEANYWSGSRTVHGMVNWLGALLALDRELYPYLNVEEAEAVDKVRIMQIKKDSKLVDYYFSKLDKYERVLRFYHARKGFGMKAKQDVATILEREMG